MSKVYLVGYTPFPLGGANDTRLPHEAIKIDKQIHKTALDAERQVPWEHIDHFHDLFDSLRKQDYKLYAVEQTSRSIQLPDFEPPQKVALIMGREVEGVEAEVIAACDGALEIPMFGQKESFNVVQAAAIALYHCRFAK